MKITTKQPKHFKRAQGISNTPVGLIITDWLNTKSQELAGSTMKGYQAKAKLIDKHFRAKEVGEIRVRCIRNFLSKLSGRNYSNKTINEYLIVLRGIFQFLMEDEEIIKDPTALIKNRTTVIREPDPFTKSELSRLLAVKVSKTLSEQALFKLGLYTGLRVSELLALAWEDVDWEKGKLHVCRAKVDGILKTPKTRRSKRTIELTPRAIEILKELMPISGDSRRTKAYKVICEDNHTVKTERLQMIFLNSKTGKPIARDSHYCKYFWKPFLKLAGVRYRPPNICRHTWASQMLTAGIPTAWISDQLGHCSEQMLYRHYAKIITKDRPNFAAMQDEVFQFLA